MRAGFASAGFASAGFALRSLSAASASASASDSRPPPRRSHGARLLGGRELIDWQTEDGRSIGGAIAWMAPFIADKAQWSLPPDIEYWNGFPVRQPSLFFGGLAQKRRDWLALWQRLDPDPTIGEVVRNFPVRQPLLWF